MTNERVDIFGMNISLHDETYTGSSFQKKGKQEHKYYLYTTRLTIGEKKGIRGTDIDNIKVPITETQYKELKKQFENSDVQCPQFVLKGNLEISVEPICIN